MCQVQIGVVCITVVDCLVRILAVVLHLPGHAPSLSCGLKGLTWGRYRQTHSVFGGLDKKYSNIVVGKPRRQLPLATPGRNGFPSFSQTIHGLLMGAPHGHDYSLAEHCLPGFGMDGNWPPCVLGPD